MKNKKGFTLAEVMIVIAIIVILSGATAIGVVSWLNNAKNTAANLEANNGENFENEARESIRKIGGTAASLQQPTETLQGTNQQTQQTQETQGTQGTQSTQQQGQGETQGTRETKETQGTTQTQAQETQAQPTQNQGGGSGSVTVGDATYTKQGTSTPGVTKCSVNGNSVTVTLYAGNNNSDASSLTNITITKQSDGTYLVDCSPAGDKYWIVSNCGISAEDYYNGKKTKQMTSDEIYSALKIRLS